jgi:hypothetical protein
MSTEASVDVLRRTLIRHGHILPTSTQRDSKSTFLNQGEFLVSLLSNDESLLDFLDRVHFLRSCNFRSDTCSLEGSKEEGFIIRGDVGVDFDLWVDTVKFVWLMHGTSESLNLIEETGFTEWTQHPLKQRHRYVDTLVLLAQKRLRCAGMKYSDMAEFFADAESAKARSVKH